ncbi:MAG TPA: hypothetical protein VK305_25890 [Roseateles sp.]|nr:hypothetical protein [Roseateles sp.]
MREISAEQAERRLAGLDALDPTGMTADVRDLARSGRAFAIEGDAGNAVYVVTVRNGCAWVTAAKGGGSVDLTEVLDRVLVAQSQGLRALGCQTARPGLVRKLKARGWQVTGWILRKDLTA